MDRHEERRFINEQKQQYGENLEPTKRYEHALKVIDVSRNRLGNTWKEILQGEITDDMVQSSYEARETYIQDAAEFFYARLKYLEYFGIEDFETKQDKLYYSFLGETDRRTKEANRALNYQPFTKKIGGLLLQPFSYHVTRDTSSPVIQYDRCTLKDRWKHEVAANTDNAETFTQQAEEESNEKLVAAGVNFTQELIEEEYAVLLEEYDRRNGLTKPTI